MNFRRGITPAVISALLLSGCSAPVTENSSPAPISAEETMETEQDTAETAQSAFEITAVRHLWAEYRSTHMITACFRKSMPPMMQISLTIPIV